MRVYLLRLLLVLTALLLFYSGYQWYQRVQDLRGLDSAVLRHNEALAQLEIGMTRSEAESKIQDVVAHYQCKTEIWATDWYLFYEKPEYSAPLHLVFEQVGIEERITAIYSPEGYLVPTGCTRLQ